MESMLTKLERTAPVKLLSLGAKQERLTLMEAVLVIKIHAEGYTCRNGESTNMQGIGHMKNSLHYLKLATDKLLFLKGKYLTRTEEYKLFGEWWERFGGTWGGRFNDGNHFSIEHEGRK